MTLRSFGARGPGVEPFQLCSAHLIMRQRSLGNRSAALDRGDRLLGRVVQVLGVDDRHVALLLREDLLGQFDVGPGQAHDQWQLQVDLARRTEDAQRDRVALHNAAKDVDEDALDLLVRRDDLERLLHHALGRAAADVEEVGRRAAVQLDDVHGGHREAGAVDEAADVAVHADVVEVEFGRGHLARVLLGRVALLKDLLLAELGVVVKVDLGVERDDAAIGRLAKGVDLDLRRVDRLEQLVQPLHLLGSRHGLVAREADVLGQPQRLLARRAGEDAERLLEDQVRRLFRDSLDVHAARGRRHKDGAAERAVHQDRKVRLA
eukprot:Unigene3303_Nuclearia_a/m.10131 Unigene3303_Nuclearia_a/g.10131  ORF Unigene3303_Nuclearia_a/g.10131 Unigene3303_Nuclearia_a/m.10131 type:complete len:320 (-) Unigene3303_Nuclearia_a:456-1415(-)